MSQPKMCMAERSCTVLWYIFRGGQSYALCILLIGYETVLSFYVMDTYGVVNSKK